MHSSLSGSSVDFHKLAFLARMSFMREEKTTYFELKHSETTTPQLVSLE